MRSLRPPFLGCKRSDLVYLPVLDREGSLVPPITYDLLSQIEEDELLHTLVNETVQYNQEDCQAESTNGEWLMPVIVRITIVSCIIPVMILPDSFLVCLLLNEDEEMILWFLFISL
ncbi:elongation factor P [Striga asiatica]|uniref:Elongation factor P n=1 Tax=Striga asiatica TaxID=4170 RepID=A0A5A7QZ50_STRAF|nr:elongation factor P [Striga asiatica]